MILTWGHYRMKKIDYKCSYGPNEDAYLIRREVFIKECGVAEDAEIDKYDEIAYQVVVYVDGNPAGTGRLFIDPENGDLLRLGRISVLEKYRGLGVAELVVGLLLKKVQEQNADICFLTGRTYIMPLYRKFGFKEEGDPFIHDNMEQYYMYAKREDMKYTDRFLAFLENNE